MDLRKRTSKIYALLERQHPDATCELNYSSALELLIATILSAQCTDVRVNLVTAELFKVCRNVQDYLEIKPTVLEKIIQSTGFFRQKAKSIKGATKIIADKFGGKVPSRMEDLVQLPGVGRKTANVVLGNAFGLPGLPVDTHVKRLTNRIGLTTEDDPVKIEFELHELLPPDKWCMFSHLLIFHGRRVCAARKPRCDECSIKKLCNFGKDRE